MPKGVYSRDGDLTSATWNDEQDEWLRLQCLTNKSYGAIAIEFNQAFPHDRKSRSAIMGRASRRGFADNKPHVKQQFGGKPKRRPNPQPSARMIRAKIKAAPIIKLAPVVFKDPTECVLRDESAPPATLRFGRKSKERIEEEKRGYLPSIVENAPLTSVPLSECADDGCKWPTNDEPFEVCGTKATIGSYCERHGNVAFREGPTRARNANYARRGALQRWDRQDTCANDEYSIAPDNEPLSAFLRKDEA